MQGQFLSIVLGFQLFLLVGYLFFAIFRTYPTREDSISLMSWITVFIGLLTFGLFGSVVFVISMMPISDIILALSLIFADIIGLYLLVDDTLKKRGQNN
ncbi:MAG: hypothetical protein E4H14_13250 [Candidatus Thorarchaeota archaeon]|nr:MAG: hypothetical protein E4H14_13250 [Candidatus Thorarchaeota archaeon]